MLALNKLEQYLQQYFKKWCNGVKFWWWEFRWAGHQSGLAGTLWSMGEGANIPGGLVIRGADGSLHSMNEFTRPRWDLSSTQMRSNLGGMTFLHVHVALIRLPSHFNSIVIKLRRKDSTFLLGQPTLSWSRSYLLKTLHYVFDFYMSLFA